MRTSCIRIVRARALVLGGVASCVAGGVFTGCFSTKTAATYARLRQDTPRAALESFVAYWKAGLHDLEFACFSRGFRERNGLSLFAYSAGRAELERRNPWLAWFASAEILAERAVDERAHVLWVEVAGRTVRVNAVREDFARIWTGDELLAEGEIDFGRALSAESDDGELRVRWRPRERYRDFQGNEVTAIRAEASWRIDDFVEVERDTVPRTSDSTAP